eukprot:g24880.t2
MTRSISQLGTGPAGDALPVPVTPVPVAPVDSRRRWVDVSTDSEGVLQFEALDSASRRDFFLTRGGPERVADTEDRVGRPRDAELKA